MQRIVVAVDLSEASLRAVDLAAELAAKFAANLVLLHVGHDVSGPDPGLEAFARMEHIREPGPTLMLEAMRDSLIPACERAGAQGAQKVSIEAVVGDPAQRILAFAAGEKADMIALGSRGHGRLAGLLLGSVAQKVVAHATCPVLVVH
jgi:nucleotide-binding universal stress UspA family protein